MPSELKTDRRGDVLVLTLSDPAARNALSAQVIAAGIEALNSSEGSDAVRSVVLRGDGAHFCAGGNLQGLAERRAAGRDTQAHMIEHLHRWIETIRAYPKPVIAAVEGAAAGAGFSLALACDLIVAADDARFALSYAKVGLTPDAGATWALSRALPRHLVTQLTWLAEPIEPGFLHRHGLVAEVVASGQALQRALDLAARLSAMATNAVSSAKELIGAAPERSLGDQLAAERDAFLDALFHRNGGEGLQAFFDKRPPRFSA